MSTPGVNPSIAEISGGTGEQKPVIDPNKAANTPPAGEPAEDPNRATPAAQEPAPGEPPADTPGEEDEPPADDEGVTPEQYYAEVAKLTGMEVDWEFPEDIDPLSPQGIQHVINKTREMALDGFEDHLRRTNPRAYAYFLHRENGGSDETFFSNKIPALPGWDSLKGSIDLQQEFYRGVLTDKGLTKTHIDLILKDAVDKKQLEGLVEQEYNRIEKEQQNTIKELERQSLERERIEAHDNTQLATKLRTHVLDNKGLSLIIPDAKRQEFLSFLSEKIMYDQSTRKHYLQYDLSDGLPNVISSMYFLFSGGDLSQLVAVKAKNLQTANLRLRLSRDKQVTSKDNPALKNDVPKPGVTTALKDL